MVRLGLLLAPGRGRAFVVGCRRYTVASVVPHGLPHRICATPDEDLVAFLARNAAALDVIRAKHKVEVKDARWYVRKAGDGARKVAGWCQAKAQAVVSVHWGEWLREALRKKSAQEKEAKRTKNLETRAETDKLMRRYYIGRDVQGTIVCKQVSFEEGCEMTAFAEKVRDAEPLFQRLPAFPDLTIRIIPASANAPKSATAAAAPSSASSSPPAADAVPGAGPTGDPTSAEARLAAAATDILGGDWVAQRAGEGFRLERRVNAGVLAEGEVIKFNETDFSVVMRDSCTPAELRDFLARDALRVSQAQKAHGEVVERVAKLVTPTVERLGLDSIQYSLKVGDETEGDVTTVVQSLAGQSIFFKRHLQGLRIRISAKAETFELDLEKDFAVIIPARTRRPLAMHIPPHYRVAEVVRQVSYVCRYLGFLVFVTVVGDLEVF